MSYHEAAASADSRQSFSRQWIFIHVQSRSYKTRRPTNRFNLLLPFYSYLCEHDDVLNLLAWRLKTAIKSFNQKNCPRSRIEVRPTALLRYRAHTRWTLTVDLDLWPWLFIPGEISSLTTHRKTQVERSVGSKDKIQKNGRTDGRNDGRTLAIALASRLTR